MRINPNLDHAQRGLLEALRCRFIAYRAGRFVRNWFNKPQNREYNLLTGPLSLAVSIVLAPLLVVTLIYWPFLTSLPRFDRAATQEAQQAIALAPDEAFSYHVLSEILKHRNRLAEANTAISEAIRLNPSDSDYYAQLAAIELLQRDWNAALAAADHGLQVDPEHVACTNLRVQALTKLGRRTDADAAVETALLRDPDNPYTHANRGWTLLEQGNPAKAMEHFREACASIRIWRGPGKALSSRSRPAISFIVGCSAISFGCRASRRAQWGVVVGLWLLFQLANYVNENQPAPKFITRPLIVAYLLFFVLTWLSMPLFNSLLRLNRFGRMVLSRKEVWQSNVVLLLLIPAIVAGVVYLLSSEITTGVYAEEIGLGCGFTAIFASTAFICSAGWAAHLL